MKTIERGSPGITRAFIDGDDVVTRAEAGQGEAIKFVATTEGVKRDGLDLRLDGLDTSNFERNPVFLWVHNYSMPPIGKVTKIRKLKKRVEMWVEFDKDDEFAVDIERKYRDGFLTAVSIGWIITEYERAAEDDEARYVVLKSDLLDLSAVPVPGDAAALMPRELAAVRAMSVQLQIDEKREWEEKNTRLVSNELWEQIEERLLDPSLGDPLELPAQDAGSDRSRDQDLTEDDCTHLDDDGTVDWVRVAAGMAGLFDYGTGIPEDARDEQYAHLKRHYRKLHRTAPELLPGIMLDTIAVRELFLEGEWAIYHEGRVVSAKQALLDALSDVRTAAENLDALLNADDEHAVDDSTPDERSFADLLTGVRDAIVVPEDNTGEETDE